MSTSVYAFGANPVVDRRLYPLSNARAEQEVLAGISSFIVLSNGRRAIQRRRDPDEDDGDILLRGESIGRSALVPFGRAQNPMFAPTPLHYEVPMAGDGTCFARHRRRLIKVSARPMFSQPGVQFRNYLRGAARA